MMAVVKKRIVQGHSRDHIDHIERAGGGMAVAVRQFDNSALLQENCIPLRDGSRE